jgi:hypothetical protein
MLLSNCGKTETWLTDDVPDSMLASNGYSIHRKDRSGRRGGGVAILLAKYLKYCPVQYPRTFESLEVVAVDLILNPKVRIVCAYRPPNATQEYTELLSSLINEITNVTWPVIILGDFNLPHIDWKNMLSPKTNEYETFLNAVVEAGLHQVVTFPTRENNVLDLILTNSPMIVSGIECCKISLSQTISLLIFLYRVICQIHSAQKCLNSTLRTQISKTLKHF